MGLGRVVASAAKAKGSLKQLIQLSLAERREHPWLDHDGYIRVSSLSDMCPREEVLAASLKVLRTKTVEASLGLVFAHGKALHWALQNSVVADTGALVGVWRCVECAKQFGSVEGDISNSQSLVRKPKKCECGCEDFLYREQHFVDTESQVGGHPDGFLILQGMPGLGILEGKSISSKGAWEIRQMPNVGHVIQLQAYFWLTGLKWGKILYWEKGGYGLQALVEHTVERDEETIEKIKSMIRSIRAGIASGLYPVRLCTSSDCPRAQKCELAAQCFKLP